ncbi:MAG: hypothetical protein MUF15_15520, partial [Acidobacteria bacterium]|nr:hypothetical protein [Acidobacteriota bacterium]
MPRSLFGALHQLVECSGLSGFETEVREKIKSMQAGYLNEISTDNIGNLVGTLSWGEGTGLSILLVAHMDEIGFLVKSINKDGTLGIIPIGKGLQEGKSFDTGTTLSHRVRIL